MNSVVSDVEPSAFTLFVVVAMVLIAVAGVGVPVTGAGTSMVKWFEIPFEVATWTSMTKRCL